MFGKVFGSWTRLGVCFKHKKLGPFEENEFLGIVDFVQISQKWTTLTMHISLNFDPKRGFLDSLEILGCPLNNPFCFISIGYSISCKKL